MKAWIPLTLALALASAVARADCSYPTAPGAPPDGNTATKDEMVASMKAFGLYNKEMTAYLDCVKLEGDAAKPKDYGKLSPEEKKKADDTQKIYDQKYSAAYDVLTTAVAQYNEQRKAFLAKHPPSK
jgi:hypothetical protein